ncbi:MAG TPA: tetratricopeptide repeat protein [Burkholderiales bacterium]|nr:tetratricopeptide repeat protein [Burkholderiales bacterium]
MTFTARLAAQLLVLALVAIAPLAHADELQDINALVKQGQHAKALERVNQYLAQKPGDPNARFAKGLILAEQNKTKEAIEVFSSLSKDYPELPEPYNNLAVLYASQGQYEKAREQLEKSIRTHPSYATAYENLGDVYTKLASQAYDKALQFDSSNSAAKNKLSLIRDLISNGRPPVAAGATTSVAAAEPAQPPAKTTPPKPAEAAPAETKPAVVAKAAPKAPEEKRPRAKDGGEDAVLQTVLAWAGAWSQKKVEAYLAFYAKDFKTPKGEGRSEWEAARRERIVNAKQIEVEVESPKVVLKDENNATVSFRQHYRSDSFKINSRKTLVMMRNEGRWVIQEERSGT